LSVTVENSALVFPGRRYVWRVLGLNIPLPGRILLGEAYVEERPIDNQPFSMKLELKHPLFGMMFNYSGRFSIASTMIEER